MNLHASHFQTGVAGLPLSAGYQLSPTPIKLRYLLRNAPANVLRSSVTDGLNRRYKRSKSVLVRRSVAAKSQMARNAGNLTASVQLPRRA